VLRALKAVEPEGDFARFSPPEATRAQCELVHDAGYLSWLESILLSGGGALDPDTLAGPTSWSAALHAAGAGLEAARRLRSTPGAKGAFLAVRPPGHHARRSSAMGFCLLNNVAITAANLVSEGFKVAVLDWDVHHGNGTQEAFYSSGEVLYCSLHQWPLFPGSGARNERGKGRGLGRTLNIPVPPGCTGDVYMRAVEEVIFPQLESFQPDWLLVSAGFDGHRDDPLADLSLTSGDFSWLTKKVMELALPGRLILFLEGGYNLNALQLSVEACLRALGSLDPSPNQESPSFGGPGGESVDEVISLLEGETGSVDELLQVEDSGGSS
jgi:acetoin utilization deacetylase AcuC-like enzyme